MVREVRAETDRNCRNWPAPGPFFGRSATLIASCGSFSGLHPKALRTEELREAIWIARVAEGHIAAEPTSVEPVAADGLEVGQQDLLTVALRPHLIWGPGDPHLVPRIVERARRGQLVQVGNGKNRVDIIYIDNAVEAHWLAWQALCEGSPVAGRCYFLSDGEPVLLWQWIKDLLTALNLPPVKKKISYRTGKFIGALMETVYSLLRLPGEPRMTRFLAAQLATSHYFDISRARRDFNYQPVVSPGEGMRRLLKSLEVPPKH